MTRRTVDQYNFDKLLFDERILDHHFTPQTSKTVKFVVIHHMAMKDYDPTTDDALKAIYNTWQTRRASAHYGVDGPFICQYVWDKDYAWATGSTEGNKYGISIEHVNSTGSPSWEIDSVTWKNGAKLTAYLHKAYIGRPVKNVTVRKHKSFTSTACPGPYMDKIWDAYFNEVVRVYDLITQATPPALPKKYPADVLDMRNVKVTLPTEGQDDKPKEVKQPQLATYSDANFHVNNAGDGVVFEARCDGFHTENSHYSRSETREMKNDGKELAAWNSADGKDHILEGTLIITEIPKEKPDVVVGQFHDGDDDVMQIRLEGKELSITIEGKKVLVLDPNLQLRDLFYYKVVAYKTGISVTYHNKTTGRRVSKQVSTKTFKDLFGKYGMYTQSNTSEGDKPSAKGRAVFYKPSGMKHVAHST